VLQLNFRRGEFLDHLEQVAPSPNVVAFPQMMGS
jgi:hypothetical protein